MGYGLDPQPGKHRACAGALRRGVRAVDAFLPAPEPASAAAQMDSPTLVDLLLQNLDSAVADDAQQAQECVAAP